MLLLEWPSHTDSLVWRNDARRQTGLGVPLWREALLPILSVVQLQAHRLFFTGGRAPTEVKVRYILMFAQRLVEQRPCL